MYGDDCVAVINCASKKLSYSAPAKDFYIGTVFKVQLEFCKKNFSNYCIISAKYGLLLPTDIVEPYNLYIGDLTDQQRKELFLDCAKSLRDKFSNCSKIYFLTTDKYAELAQYVTGECIFLLDGLRGRQKLHYLKTGDRNVVDLDKVLDEVVQRMKPGIGYKKMDICHIIKDILPAYSSTYINRIVTCSTIDGIGEKGLKQRDIFEIHDHLYYLVGTHKKRRRTLF